MAKKEESDSSLKKMDVKAALIGVIAVIGIFIIPLLVTKCSIVSLEVEKPNEIGDTIGGILSPFIGLISAFLVYLTFREQIKANRIIQKQFDELQIEKLELVEFKFVKSEIKYLINELKNYEFNGFKGYLALHEVYEHLKKGENLNYSDCRDIIVYPLKFSLSINHALNKISNKHLLRQIELLLNEADMFFSQEIVVINIEETDSEDLLEILRFNLMFKYSFQNLKLKNINSENGDFGTANRYLITLDNLLVELNNRLNELKLKKSKNI